MATLTKQKQTVTAKTVGNCLMSLQRYISLVILWVTSSKNATNAQICASGKTLT